MDKEVLNKFLVEMTEALRTGIKQIPLVAQEILNYNMAITLLGVAVGIVLLVMAIVLAVKIYKTIQHDEHKLDNWFGLYAIPAALFVISMMQLFSYVPDALKIYLAPRAFLLEYIAHLVRHIG